MGVGFLGRGCIGAFSGNCVVAIWGRERGGYICYCEVLRMKWFGGQQYVESA